MSHDVSLSPLLLLLGSKSANINHPQYVGTSSVTEEVINCGVYVLIELGTG